MAKLEFVAGVVDALRLMQATMADVPEIAAEEFLASTLVDEPTPPRNTGELRNSGAAYIGSKLVATTQSLAATHPRVSPDMLTPRTLLDIAGNKVRANPKDGLSTFRHLDDVSLVPKKLGAAKLSEGAIIGTKGYVNRKLATVRGKITVMYQAPHAALMHEWTGRMHEPGSGPGFISSKAFRFQTRMSTRVKQIHDQRMAGRKRR